MRTPVTIPAPDYAPDRGDCGPMIELPRRPAHYRRLGCERVWQGLAGPTTCPYCDGVYLLWLKG